MFGVFALEQCYLIELYFKLSLREYIGEKKAMKGGETKYLNMINIGYQIIFFAYKPLNTTPSE